MMVDPWRAKGKLHCLRFAEQHHTSLIEASDNRGIRGGDIVFQQVGTSRRGQTLNVNEIFHGIGNAMQWASILPGMQGQFRGPCGGESALTWHEPEAVEGTI
jgi:hypothetical protein